MDNKPAVREVAQSAQRRQLTVMFCDMVDSTPLAARLDPEDMTQVYRIFRDLCASTIQAAGGHVAKYMGDGVLAYFGFPRVHEDDAERAVHAALAISRAAPALPVAHETPLAARIGIATGLVIVGDVVGDTAVEQGDVVGETPNLAARLQSISGRNEIVVSDLTQRLASGLFAFDNIGRPPLKGLTLKEPAWRVIGERQTAERFHGRRRARRTPMMGREAEFDVLMARWRRCQDGEPQLVGVVGEAGIGKSRLVEAFHRAIAPRGPHIWLEGGGAQIFGNTPFHPVAQAIHRQLTDGEPLLPDKLLRRLKESLSQVDAHSDEAQALIGELLETRPAGLSAPLIGAPEQRRHALIDALADWLLKSADRWPTVLALEDLQWVDPSTLEFLQTVMARASGARLMVLYTSRPEDPVPWQVEETRIELGRLDRENVRNLIVAAAPGAIAPDLLESIVARAGGVPLFAEELALLIGEDPKGSPDVAIPSALSDLLMARLDQLGPAKGLAQVAAVLGGGLPLPLLGEVAGVGESELRDFLETLVAENVMVASDANGQSTYAFRHALIEGAAYESLLRPLRRTLHRRTAEVIVARFPEMAERRPEILAQHWLKAGESEKAVSAWRQAARLAFRRYALRETIHACEQGLAIVRSLKASPDLEREEIGLQSLLADAARGVEGYGSPRVLRAIERAKELAERHGGVAERMERALGEWAARSSVGDVDAAVKAGDSFIELARVDGGADALASAHMILLTRYRQGDLPGAENAYQGGVAHFGDPGFLRRPGAAPQVYGSAAIVAWLLGMGDEATRRAERGIAVSQATGNPYNHAYACHMAAQLTLLAGAPAEAARLASDSLKLSAEHGFALTDLARITLGRAMAAQGRAAEGVTMIEEALFAPGRRPTRGSQTMYLTWLAEAHAMAGDAERAAAVLEQALTVNSTEIFYRPESLRVRGDLCRGRGDPEAAAADYQSAVDLARSMGASTLLQRAASSLSGLEGNQAESWR